MVASNKPINLKERTIYLLPNKPIGYVSTVSDDFKRTFKENLRIIQNDINKLSNKLNVAKKEMAELERCQTIKLRTKKSRIKKKQQTRQAKIIENSEVLDKFFPFELSKFIDIQEEDK